MSKQTVLHVGAHANQWSYPVRSFASAVLTAKMMKTVKMHWLVTVMMIVRMTCPEPTLTVDTMLGSDVLYSMLGSDVFYVF